MRLIQWWQERRGLIAQHRNVNQASALKANEVAVVCMPAYALVYVVNHLAPAKCRNADSTGAGERSCSNAKPKTQFNYMILYIYHFLEKCNYSIPSL